MHFNVIVKMPSHAYQYRHKVIRQLNVRGCRALARQPLSW